MKIFDDLYYFFKVVRYGSLIKAAKNLEIEQGTLSYALKRLEEKFNKKLLIRKKIGIELTPEGVDLYHCIVDQYTSLDQILVNSKNSNQEIIRKELKIITTTGIVSLLIIPAIKEFLLDYPDIRVDLETYDGEIIFHETNSDVAILPTIVDTNQVVRKHLTKIKTKLFISKKYIEQFGKPRTVEDLKNHRFIGYYTNKTNYKGDVDWHLKLANNKTPVFRVNSAIAQLYAAKLGLGITSFPKDFPYISDDFEILFDAEKSLSVDVYYISRKDYNNPLIDLFYIYAKKELNKNVE